MLFLSLLTWVVTMYHFTTTCLTLLQKHLILFSDHSDGRGHPNPEAQADPESKCDLPFGEAQDLLRPSWSSLVQSAVLPPEPVPQLHRSQRREATLFPKKVLTRWTLLHCILIWPDISGGEKGDKRSLYIFFPPFKMLHFFSLLSYCLIQKVQIREDYLTRR